MNEKVLILGATGTMGHYLTEKLAADGCQVDAVSLDSIASSRPNLRYIQVKNAKDPAFVAEITQNSYDAIVDFLIYDTISFRETFPHYLKCTGQYVYLSSLPRVCQRGESHPGNFAPPAGRFHRPALSLFG